MVMKKDLRASGMKAKKSSTAAHCRSCRGRRFRARRTGPSRAPPSRQQPLGTEYEDQRHDGVAEEDGPLGQEQNAEAVTSPMISAPTNAPQKFPSPRSPPR